MPPPAATHRLILSPAEREQIRGLIAHACEPVAPFWPMRTFIHHNPLHGLETRPFDRAVRDAERLLGGRGFPDRKESRTLCRTGRVSMEGIRRALRRHVPWSGEENPVTVGTHRITAEDVLLLQIAFGFDPTTPAALHWRRVHEDATARFRDDVPGHTREEALARLALSSRLEDARREPTYIRDLWQATLDILKLEDVPHLDADEEPLPGHTPVISRSEGARTVADRIAERTGIDLVDQINQEMIKWCAAFVDEGFADWGMPERERGFYAAWKTLAVLDRTLSLRGVTGWTQTLRELPEVPEDAIVDALHRLGVPEPQWVEYLSRHLAQLPGWAGFIRWRSDNPDYGPQRRHPIALVDYLAVRLLYEREVVRLAGLHGAADAPPATAARGSTHDDGPIRDRSLARLCYDGWRWFHLAQFLALAPDDARRMSPRDSQTLLDWLDRFPPEAEGPVWLEAYEEDYRRSLLGTLVATQRPEPPASRAEAQAVFCIDVRSEVLRRHLEAQGAFETFGFAGFFGVPLRYRGLGQCDELALCPVLVMPKHRVAELPRPGQTEALRAYALGRGWQTLAHRLFHDLKGSPLGSVALIDVLGLFFTAGLIGKTLCWLGYSTLQERIRGWLIPTVGTRIRTVKASPEEAEAWIAARERADIADWLRRRPDPQLRRMGEDLEAIESLRIAAMREPQPAREPMDAVLAALRRDCGLSTRDREARWEALALEGFTVFEQAAIVEAALRVFGLTQAFAPLVLLCGHGSATENNPYAAALDCGACGGSHGDPNARVLASMANSADVRALLRERGLAIPNETWFLAGKHNTTTDEIRLYDLEDVPSTKASAVDRLVSALARASAQAAAERCGRLPPIRRRLTPSDAARTVLAKSRDWAQVRPEWGLSRNAAFLIGRRALTAHLNLRARVFLHSYEPDQDPTGRLLEIIMTAPMIVAEWINMEHYFSAADPWTYGSGSKVIHNVVGGIGVMLGRQSDLQTGLPLQTVNDGARRYHEPMRLLIVIEAPRGRISPIVQRHEILQHLLHHQWVTLTVLEPDGRDVLRYLPSGQWEPLPVNDP